MKESKGYKLVQLENLLALREAEKAQDAKSLSDRAIKKASSEDTTVTVARFEADATPITPDTDLKQSAEPNASHGSGNPMPASLEGISQMNIHLLWNDNQMSKDERAWYSNRCRTRSLMNRMPSEFDWMRM